MAERLICLLIGYCFGLFQTSYIIGRMHGIDIRTKGSGNAGTTNALRVLGKKAGLATVLCDSGKCILAAIVVCLIFRNTGELPAKLLVLYASAGAILGHNYPFYLGFRGGKGIATSVGMIIAFLDWRLMIVAAICFFGAFLTTHYVSLGSLALSSGFLIGMIVNGQLGVYEITQNVLIEMYCIAACLTAIAFIKHRGNIKRLITGTERKTYLGKKHKIEK